MSSNFPYSVTAGGKQFDLEDLIFAVRTAAEHMEAVDKANAAKNCSEVVMYSPLTKRLQSARATLRAVTGANIQAAGLERQSYPV